MRLLLVHQNFPGQFRDLAPALCDLGHEIKAIGNSQRPIDERIELLLYPWEKNNKLENGHRLTPEVDEWLRRGEKVGALAMALKQKGWAPDAMLAHPGWGEALMLKTVFPNTPLVIWPELWLRPEHLGIGIYDQIDVANGLYLRLKDWLVDGAMADADIAVLPTQYQANSFPERWQHKIRVLHEGVHSKLFQQQRLRSLKINENITLDENKLVITFISRNLEPMRGFPDFMRSLPTLQKQCENLEVVIVGGDELSYSTGPNDGRSWKEVMLDELGKELNLQKIHFFGRMPHDQLIKLYRRSNLHIYLSQAFVLSWSLLEVMACGTAVVGDDNKMLREIIEPGKNGWLCKKDPEDLAKVILEALSKPSQLNLFGNACQQKMHLHYHQNKCTTQLDKLLRTLTQGKF